jgi:hypothetical protein
MPQRGVTSIGGVVFGAKIVINPPQLRKTCGKVISLKAP